MIEVRGVTKQFDGRAVLDNVSLHIARGEIYALLGENGAGKTTLLKILAGIYAPVEGAVTIGGLDRQKSHVDICRFTSWLADQPFVYGHLTGRRWLETIAGIYGVDPERRETQIAQLLALFDLTEVASKKVVYYSNGQYKKLAIAGMLISNARLFIMDEPFTGEIDPPGVVAFKELLRELRASNGVTAVFSTQMVDQAEQVATRVGILSGGRIVAEGTAAELKERFAARSMEEVFVNATRKAPVAAREFVDGFGR